MKTPLFIVFLLCCCISVNAQLSEADKEFATNVVQGGIFEVRLGLLAQSKGESPETRALGRMMAEDHSKANNEFKALAVKKGFVIPTSMSEKHQKMYDILALENGKDFDRKYCEMMVKDNEKDLSVFRKQAAKGHDAEVKAWSAGKISMLEHHLHMSNKSSTSAKK